MRGQLLAGMLLFSQVIVHGQTKTNWSPEQCMKMKNITSVRVSPDGKKVLYTVRQAVMTDERSEYVNQIFLCNIDGSNQVQLTQGDKNNSNPKWNFDGSKIAFTSNRDGKSNLYVISPGGGEADRIT
ncbi:MAG TPA: hypothetical protein VNV85_15805, partial [Puia sp.]|nr:hypothetical protein [Puia sp.]